MRSAIVAACSVGSASASSNELVWIDCAPPATAESAWIATRTMLFSGCCAVSVEPPVCAWKRSASAFGFVAPKSSDMIRVHSRRAARNFATSWKKSLCALKKKDSCSPKRSGESPAATAARPYAMPFASVNASSCTAVEPASRMWYPEIEIVFQRGIRSSQYANRSVVSRIDGCRREDVVAARDVLLQDVVLHRAAEVGGRNALAFRDELVEKQEQRRRRVDRHRRRDVGERDAGEQDLHVGERVDRDAGAADLAERTRIVGVVAELRRQVERDRESRLAVVEQIAVALVRLLRARETGVLTDRPRLAAVHVRVRPARERRLARRLERPRRVGGGVDRLHLDAGLVAHHAPSMTSRARRATPSCSAAAETAAATAGTTSRLKTLGTM